MRKCFGLLRPHRHLVQMNQLPLWFLRSSLEAGGMAHSHHALSSSKKRTLPRGMVGEGLFDQLLGDAVGTVDERADSKAVCSRDARNALQIIAFGIIRRSHNRRAYTVPLQLTPRRKSLSLLAFGEPTIDQDVPSYCSIQSPHSAVKSDLRHAEQRFAQYSLA